MEKTELKLDRNRRRVKSCPCGKSNKDGKFAPFKNHEKFGYCHSCTQSFFPNTNNEIAQVYELPKPISELDGSLVQKAGRNFKNNNFIQWLKTRFNNKQIKDAVTKYLLGTSKHWNGAIVFWQIDKFERIRAGKIMQYDSSNGKRVKVPYTHVTWVQSVLKTPHFCLKQCLFGEHLINEFTNCEVAIVEAEKTAVFMSMMHTDKIWLATGSKGNFNYPMLKSLFGRTIRAYPDKGEIDNWNEVVIKLNEKGFNVTVDPILEKTDLPDGSDLVDYIEAGYSFKKPSQKKHLLQTKAEMEVMKLYKMNNNISLLIKTFDLMDDLGFNITLP